MAVGDFGSVLASLKWDEITAYFPTAAQVKEGLILIANLRTAGFTDPGLYLYTVSVTAGGALAVVDWRRFDATATDRPSKPVLVDGQVWAVVYGTNSLTRLATFSIDGDGNISAELSGRTLFWEPSSSIYVAGIVNVRAAAGGGFVFLVAGTDDDTDGKMTSLIVQSDGTVGVVLTTWEYDTSYGRYPLLYRCNDDRVAFIWASGLGFSGKAEYVDVSSDGTFTHPDKDIGIGADRGGGMARVGTTDFYVVVLDTGGATVWIEVIEIPPTGTADPTRGAPWSTATENNSHPKIMEFSRNIADNGSVFIMMWGGGGMTYNCASFEVLDTGVINESFIDTFASIAGSENPYVGMFVKGIDTVCVAVFRAHDDLDEHVGWAASVLVEGIPATPTVTTDPASGATAESITLNGTLDLQGAAPTYCGFEWGPDTGYGTTTATQTKSTTETFSQALRGLQPGTTYHFRAFATNPVGTSYGADRSFTTSPVITRAYALAREEL